MEDFHEVSQKIFRAKYLFNDLLDDIEDEKRKVKPKHVLKNENRTFIPFDTKVYNIPDETLYEFNEFIVNNSFGAFRQKMYYDDHLKTYDEKMVFKNIKKVAKLVKMMDEYVDLKSAFVYTPPEPEAEDFNRRRFRKFKVPDSNLCFFKHHLVHTQKMGPEITTRHVLIDRIKALIDIQKELDDLLHLEDFIGDSDEKGFWIPTRVKFSYDAFKYAKDPRNGIEIVELSSEDIPTPLETYSRQISDSDKSRNQKTKEEYRNSGKGRYSSRTSYPRKSNSYGSSGNRSFGNGYYKSQDKRWNFKSEGRNSGNRSHYSTSNYSGGNYGRRTYDRKPHYSRSYADHTGFNDRTSYRNNYGTNYREGTIHIERTNEERTSYSGIQRKSYFAKSFYGEYTQYGDNFCGPKYSGNNGKGPRKNCWTNKNYYYKGSY